MSLTVRTVGPESAEAVWDVVHRAFAARPPLDPPADALSETVASLSAALAAGGGLLAELDGRPVGAAVLDPVGSVVFLRRFGVIPDHQHHGVAHALASAARDVVDSEELAVLAREELPATVGFWEAAGFVIVARYPPYLELRRSLVTSYDVPDADAMRDLGRRVAESLRPGDLVVLTGGLGAGKTTFTQGIGVGLGVRGDITSPTFVIARMHPSLVGGPDLVHVDAYRLGGFAELDDLDLDASLDESVTVVEWGGGLAEGLSDSRLEILIERSVDAEVQSDLDPRRVKVREFGPRWSTPQPG